MKYIITERQLEVIEIGTARGRYDTSPELILWRLFNNEMKKKHKIEAFKNFFSKNLGKEYKKIGDKSILHFFDYLQQRFIWDGDIKTNPDTESGFAYYIAKNYFGIKEGHSLSFLKIKDYRSHDYFFFDRGLKIFVGCIKVSDYDKLPRNSYKVDYSAVVKPLIGTGYGTKMYLSVLSDVDYLRSDDYLFTGSLRIWRDVLPKYVNVWTVYEFNDSIFTKVVRQTPGKRVKAKDADFFVASMKRQSLDFYI